MPNRAVRRKSVVDLLSKVPLNKGSLLTSIENLLKTIESSESAVMIPTLLRDKCEFDAWELLFVAKILKASILGHVDLVEFYMNHIGLNSSQFAASQTSNTTTNGTNGSNGTAVASGTTPNNTDPSNQSLSPSSGRQSSPVLSPTGSTVTVQLQQQVNLNQLPASWSISSTSSISSSITTNQLGGIYQPGPNSSSKSQSQSVSWTAASQQSSSSAASAGLSPDGNQTEMGQENSIPSHQQQQHQQQPQAVNEPAPAQESLLAPVASVRGQLVRQAQPPSLLQLTTTNNHINSVAAVAAGFTNNAIEQLTNQLSNMQTNGCLATNGKSLDGALSISTVVAPVDQQQSGAGTTTGGSGSSPSSQTMSNGMAMGGMALAATLASAANSSHAHPPHAELRSSRSAGCLFRINSGASSPRTPTSTYPQAETLANGQVNGLPGDPSAPVKLLLQIEQLKLSISHVTSLLESVVELYKKSIDNIAMA